MFDWSVQVRHASKTAVAEPPLRVGRQTEAFYEAAQFALDCLEVKLKVAQQRTLEERPYPKKRIKVSGYNVDEFEAVRTDAQVTCIALQY